MNDSNSPASPRKRHFGPVLAMEVADGGHYAVQGRPVWPLRNPDERQALERMVSTMGGEVELVTEALPQELSGPGVVVGLGPRAFEDARLYAHLTMRSFRGVQSREELEEGPLPTVVVTTFDQVDEELLDLLYDCRPVEHVPGLIFAFTDRDLRAQVLARSATLQCPPRVSEQRRIDIYTQLPLEHAEVEGLRVLGGRATPEQIREAMGSRPSLLTLATHSDGIDAQLVPDLVFCPMDRVPEDHDPGLSPSCHLTGYCHRNRRPIPQALEDGVLLSPSDVRADVMIHSVCWGLYPAPGVQCPKWSLLRRLLEEMQIGAVLTTWEIVVQNANTTIDLCHDIATGVPLGRALARHLSLPETLRQGHRLCLLGDPDLQLPLSDDPNPLPPSPDGRAAQGLSPDRTAALALLRGMIFEARRSQPPGRPDTSEEALQAILAYEMAAMVGAPLEGPERSPGPRLRRAVVEYFAYRYSDASRYWLPYADTLDTDLTRRPCPACGRRTVSRIYPMRLHQTPPRHHVHCPTCGPVGDVPEGRSLTIRVDEGGTIHLGGDLPSECWDAQLILDTQIPSMHATWPWPANEHGAPVRSFRPPHRWPEIPLRVAVMVVRESGEFAVAGCLCRVIDDSPAHDSPA